MTQQVHTARAQGRGDIFMAEILSFIAENYDYETIRLHVASFNQRAIKVSHNSRPV